ncbi:MAG TPA: hypothetical protein VKB19_19820 [Pedobacter sp.]|nr:hypothetical protein [Pedobacter sp.]
MKGFFTTLLLLLTFSCAMAQTNTFPTTGNVGIATGSVVPGAKLSFNNLNDGTNGADGITWYSPNPLKYGIFRTAGTWVAPNYQQLKLSWESGIVMDPGTAYGKSYVDVQGAGLRITSGNLGVGTADTKGYRLAVAGSMVAESVTVKLQGIWPDFVFAKDYKLPSLHEIEKHIKEQGHLPGIPSAAEVQADGIELGEMNRRLLQKIEELTLHLISEQKLVQEVRQELDMQKAQILKLKIRLDKANKK